MLNSVNACACSANELLKITIIAFENIEMHSRFMKNLLNPFIRKMIRISVIIEALVWF